MLMFVICFNLCLATVNFYIAVQLWVGSRTLARLNRHLLRLDRCVRRCLEPIPKRLFVFKQELAQSKSTYQYWQRRGRFLLFLGQGLQGSIKLIQRANHRYTSGI
jgi:hypothetical protein